MEETGESGGRLRAWVKGLKMAKLGVNEEKNFVMEDDLCGQGCPVCGGTHVLGFFEVLNVPVEEGILFSSKEQALNCPTGDIKLSFCSSCGYIGNRAYIPEKVKFDTRYDVSLHHSPLYEEFVYDLASRLIKKYSLYKKTILEIGCGKGEFLRTLCRLGENRGFGFDPTFDEERISPNSEAVSFVRDFYTERYAGIKNDFICCRHVLEIVPSPRDFMKMVWSAMGEEKNKIVYFEVPNAAYTFRDLVVWNIVYTNGSYFYPEALARLFTSCGFEVLDINPCFQDDQYLGVEAIARDKAPPSNKGAQKKH